jgi:hypothetical protein
MIRLRVSGAGVALLGLTLAPASWPSTCPPPVAYFGDPTGSNGQYDVVIGERHGAYAARMGVDHPVTQAFGQQWTLLMGNGHFLAPGLASASVRSFNSQTDYRFGLLSPWVLMDDDGFACVPSSWRPPPEVTRVARDDSQVVGLAARFDVHEPEDDFAVTVRIVAHGSVFEDSAVEVTTEIENLAGHEARLGLRHFWDVGVLRTGKLAIGTVPPDPPYEPWETGEVEWPLPAFDYLLAAWTPIPTLEDPYYFAGVSVAGPWTLEPRPTPPEAIVPSIEVTTDIPEERGGPENTCFAWEAPVPPRGGPHPIAGSIESMVYFWGRTEDTALRLAPGEARSFTTWFWAFLQNPVTCDAGGPYDRVECTGSVTPVQIDATGSATVDRNPLQNRWSSADPAVAFDDARSARRVALLPGVGRYPLRLDVGIGPYVRACETWVEVVDTTPPDLRVPPDLTLRTSEHGPDACSIAATLTAQAEDACSLPVTITHVTDPFVGSGGAVATHDFPPGTTRGVFTARDALGNASQRETSVTVIDDTPPVFRVLEAEPAVLWPPRHDLREVTLRVEATDNCSASPAIRLVSVESSEPADDRGDGLTQPDVQGAALGTPDTSLRLRAERDGRQAGRTYTIRYQAEDDWGNVALGVAQVVVPHDRRPVGARR